jgi:RNA polymerase sigma-70 factor (ECF subfamily)
VKVDTGSPATTVSHDAADSVLIARSHAGDQQAFAVLYDRYSRLVYSVALRVVKDPATAEDVLHDIFMQLWRDPRRFDSARGDLAPWLAVIARNRAIDRIRRLKPQVDVEDVVLSYDSDAAGQLDRADNVRKVRSALQQMPDEQRAALEMAFFDGLTHMEIAEKTGEPLGTIKTRIRSALMAIRKTIR